MLLFYVTLVHIFDKKTALFWTEKYKREFAADVVFLNVPILIIVYCFQKRCFSTTSLCVLSYYDILHCTLALTQ